jgi:hypothetical protein
MAPGPSIASRAFTARLSTAISNWLGSAFQRAHIDRRRLQRLPAGEGQQALHQHFGPLRVTRGKSEACGSRSLVPYQQFAAAGETGARRSVVDIAHGTYPRRLSGRADRRRVDEAGRRQAGSERKAQGNKARERTDCPWNWVRLCQHEFLASVRTSANRDTQGYRMYTSTEHDCTSLTLPPAKARPTLHLSCGAENLSKRVCSRYRTPRPTARISTRSATIPPTRSA